ncbi:uncharacterized protein TNCV_783251 [Trichonephila clavipes]|nr:uncharacterized protein TNCV_783251 [Trichonephila clavipes]
MYPLSEVSFAEQQLFTTINCLGVETTPADVLGYYDDPMIYPDDPVACDTLISSECLISSNRMPSTDTAYCTYHSTYSERAIIETITETTIFSITSINGDKVLLEAYGSTATPSPKVAGIVRWRTLSSYWYVTPKRNHIATSTCVTSMVTASIGKAISAATFKITYEWTVFPGTSSLCSSIRPIKRVGGTVKVVKGTWELDYV